MGTLTSWICFAASGTCEHGFRALGPDHVGDQSREPRAPWFSFARPTAMPIAKSKPRL